MVDGGAYVIKARLVAWKVLDVGRFATEVTLAAGYNEFTLTFPWDPIAEVGMDGPFTIEDLSIYLEGAADVLGLLVLAHTTLAYHSDGRVG